VTGNEPPSPTDPETPVLEAASWALASGIGVGVTQLLTQRMAARHWEEKRSATKRLMQERSSSTFEGEKHHPAPRSGAQGGVLSGLTAPISPVHRLHLVSAPRGPQQPIAEPTDAAHTGLTDSSLSDHALDS
jgi:hypothetical protein